MLEVRDLKKYYKTKGGVEVHALDGVSIQFPETGMVFLLGKSGSGKSTLLNVSGGLDKPDSGEIIVKGKSSKDFTQSDFDSYRNTFIGFVFQEYNILSEFNVETNIGLALELQGKKNDKKAVDDLLKQVDLEGMGKRKPNTLSGGQKQRIAIARALIKNPEIIMADEPTGALDSNTGKQVLDTLKKLSETKLIIIVSHDRDFAEEYADRIIELKDGKVISDHSKSISAATKISSNVTKVGDGTIQIKDIDTLSESELKDVLKSLKGKGEVIISNNENNVTTFKKIAKISDDGGQQYFKDTDLKAVNIKSYDGSQTKFIKSKLPAKHALKMGASNLKIKPGRLVFTMFLSVIAFSMFGILSTLMLYNAAFSQAKGLQEEAYESLVMEKKYNVYNRYYRYDRNGKEELGDEYVSDRATNISKEDIENLNKNSLNLEFAGIYNKEIDISGYLANSTNLEYYSNSSIYGLCDCGEDFLLRQRDFERLAGHYPENNDEIAVSDYIFEVFKECDFRSPDGIAQKQINNENDLIGQKISVMLRNYSSGLSKTFDFKISGVYKTDSALKNIKYDILKEENHMALSDREYKVLRESFKDVYQSSFAGLGYISTNFYETNRDYLQSDYTSRMYVNGEYLYGLRFLGAEEYKNYKNGLDDKSYFFPSDYESMGVLTTSNVQSYGNLFKYFDINGNEIAGVPAIKDDEIYLNAKSYHFRNIIQNMMNDSVGQMRVRYNRDGELSYYKGNENGCNGEMLYISSDNSKVSLTEKEGYFPVQGEVIIDDNENVIAYSKTVYMNNDYDAYTDVCDNNHPNEAKAWFDPSNFYLGSEINNTFKRVDLSHFYYDSSSKKIYLEDEVDKRWDSVEFRDIYYPKGTSGTVSLKRFDTYYLDANGEPKNDASDYNAEYRKGLFVNRITGEVSFKKQANSVFTDVYYKDTNNVIRIGLKIYEGYSTFDIDNNKVYSYTRSFCGLGYVDMEYVATKAIHFIDKLDNFKDVLKAIVKFYAIGNDSWLVEDLRNNYGYGDNVIDFDQVATQPLTSADVKALISALDAYETEYGNKPYTLSYKSPVAITTKNQMVNEMKIGGIFVADQSMDVYQDLLLNDEWKNRAFQPDFEYSNSKNVETTKYKPDSTAQYSSAITMCDKTSDQLKFMLKEYEDDSFYRLDNQVSNTILTITSMLKELKLVFLIIGSVMALFSGLMLLNFISTSISNKQKEIGILRAVGARGSDVFKIFFSEAAIICLICVFFSIILTGVSCFIFNTKIAENLTIQFFEFGPINIGIIFAIAFVVGLFGTLLPVTKASRRPPVESIRAL